MQTESQQLISNYLSWAAGGDTLTGTSFKVTDAAIIIIQELDEEEEPDKYVIMKQDVTEDEWNQMLDLIKRQSK